MTDTTNTTSTAGEGEGNTATGSGLDTGAAAAVGAAASGKEPGRGRSGTARAKKTLRAKALGVVQLERGGKVVEIPPGEEFDASAEELDSLIGARFAVRVGDDDEAAE
ncbi:hypothetical protein [Variovorax sp. 3P27G3]|jgi:hypothetical protein|uniref:hypothetical protein n=1 Tax=Variovorax sp. 3P27G3 TaxID=2502214 RepID=UPI0010F994BD|nr:hypothetical protein [Variovorax sp. 3P27G3]